MLVGDEPDRHVLARHKGDPPPRLGLEPRWEAEPPLNRTGQAPVMSLTTYLPQPTTTPAGSDMDGLDTIPAAAWNAGGALSMLAGLFWMLATGRIVTRREHEGRIADKNEVIATQAKTIDVKDAQLERIVIVGETTVKILESVETFAKRQQ